MNIKLIKLSYAILSIIAGLTVGVVLSLYVGLMSCIQTLIVFPFQIYTNCVANAIEKKIKAMGSPAQGDEDMWDRHIQRMEEQSKNN
tara:strand:+ start:291 stop:551 length:261 start_codon:yes stop_codon:yes gene_type:complete